MSRASGGEIRQRSGERKARMMEQSKAQWATVKLVVDRLAEERILRIAENARRDRVSKTPAYLAMIDKALAKVKR